VHFEEAGFQACEHSLQVREMLGIVSLCARLKTTGLLRLHVRPVTEAPRREVGQPKDCLEEKGYTSRVGQALGNQIL
jgi:hypothetical protein